MVEKAWQERKEYPNLPSDEIIRRLFSAMQGVSDIIHRLHEHQKECNRGDEFEHQCYRPIQESWIRIEGGILQLYERLRTER